jgi:hypothetical protein
MRNFYTKNAVNVVENLSIVAGGGVIIAAAMEAGV